IEGYQMARNGRAGAALAVSAIGSFVAGTTGIVALTLLSLPLAAFALKFGPAEYFCLMVFAMAAVSSLTGKSMAKGILSTLLGLMIATVGIELQNGVSFVVAVVGLFAIGEVFSSIEEYLKGRIEFVRVKGKLWLTREEWR